MFPLYLHLAILQVIGGVIMKRRIFLAVNLPDEIKKKLAKIQEEWIDLPVRWTRKENLHITLIFLGYLGDEELLKVIESVKKTTRRYKSFEIGLNRVCFGPPGRPPRMIWVEGERNIRLFHLKDDLEEELFQYGGSKEKKSLFRPHVTLARIKPGEWQELNQKPKIEKEISLAFSVDSVDVMESILSRKGPDYSILERNNLKLY